VSQNEKRVLVVGTTPDYIDLLCRRYPGRTVFLTDPDMRACAREPTPDETTEILCDLNKPDETLDRLETHLLHRHIEVTGVACYDCESMSLAAFLGRTLSLPYPSPGAVTSSRNKLISKQLWQQAGLPCPKVEMVERETDAIDFIQRIEGPAVIKPLSGSGSELTFLVSDETECSAAYRTMRSRLADHPNVRMYAPLGGNRSDPRRVFAIEEYVGGTEYSCDFILDENRIEIIRIARKIPASSGPFGTTLAYVVPSRLPTGLNPDGFKLELHEAARTLGLSRAMVMLDFIVRDNRAILVEMTPRPGGDCLPFLLERCSGFDILGAALDFAEGRFIKIPEPDQWRELVGVRLFAKSAGFIREIDTSQIEKVAGVVDCYIKYGAGHEVVMPPDDYGSRILGHVIFQPSQSRALEDQCAEIAGGLLLVMDLS